VKFPKYEEKFYHKKENVSAAKKLIESNWQYIYHPVPYRIGRKSNRKRLPNLLKLYLKDDDI
jgi:hypothetical protein